MSYVIWVLTMKTHRYLFYNTTIHKWLYCIFPTSTCFQQLLSPLGEFSHIIPVHCGYSWNDSIQIPASNAINNVYTSIRNHDPAMPIRFCIRTVMRPAPETSDIGLQHSAWLYFLISGIMFVRRCRQRSIYHFGFHKSIFSPFISDTLKDFLRAKRCRLGRRKDRCSSPHFRQDSPSSSGQKGSSTRW